MPVASLIVDPLFDWLTPLPSAESMRAVDRWAIDERGVDGLELMESAGAAVARVVEELTADGPVTVVCGKGNNGGDGLVVARLLRHGGHEVRVLCTASPDEFKGDARVNLERLPGPAPLRLYGTPWGQADWPADAQGSGTVQLGSGGRRAARHRLRRRATRRGGRRDRGHQRFGCCGGERGRAQRRGCQHRCGGRRRGQGQRHGHLSCGQARAVDPAGQGQRRGGAHRRHRNPAWRATAVLDRPDRGLGRAAAAAQGSVLDEVQLRARAGGGRLARPDGRSGDGRAWPACARAPAT